MSSAHYPRVSPEPDEGLPPGMVARPGETVVDPTTGEIIIDDRVDNSFVVRIAAHVPEPPSVRELYDAGAAFYRDGGRFEDGMSPDGDYLTLASSVGASGDHDSTLATILGFLDALADDVRGRK